MYGLGDTGAEATAVVLNPTDWTTIELVRDSHQRFLLDDSPTAKPPRLLWNLPVVTSTSMPQGKALVVDFRSAGVMDREQVEILAFESGLTTEGTGTGTGTSTSVGHGTSLESRNLFKLRAEQRCAPLVTIPAAFKIASLTA